MYKKFLQIDEKCWINDLPVSKEDFEVEINKIDQSIKSLNNFSIPSSILPAECLERYIQGQPKEKNIFDRELNIFEINEFLSKNDGYYALCLNDNCHYQYLSKGGYEDLCGTQTEDYILRYGAGLYEIDNDGIIILDCPLASNAKTQNYKFKLISIEDFNERSWIDCTLKEALQRLEDGFTIKSIQEDYSEQKYRKDRLNFKYDTLLHDIKHNYNWKYFQG